jgi:ribonuclease P protein subunit RPR2
MPKKRFNKPAAQQKIAEQRILDLLDLARKQFDSQKELSKRYTSLARKIALKYKIRLPAALKRNICKHCHALRMQGKNLRVRTLKGHLVYTCLECKGIMRYVYKK